MELYLFRHGIAEDPRPGSPDADRRLTDEGRVKAAAVARMARDSGAEVSLILSSPYVRAVQTAEIAAREFGCPVKTVRAPSLVPDSEPEDAWDEIRCYRDEPAILLASHEPLLSRLAAFLLHAPELHIEMKKSALVRIDVSVAAARPHGVLRWMLVPRVVRASM